MFATRRSPLQFGLRFLFLLLAVSAVLSAVLAVAVEEPALLFLLGLAGAAAGLTCIGRYILGPLDQAARDQKRPTQFTMVDFLALVFLFQLPMAALHGLFDVRQEPRVWFFDAFAWIACCLMWGFSVATLSRRRRNNVAARRVPGVGLADYVLRFDSVYCHALYGWHCSVPETRYLVERCGPDCRDTCRVGGGLFSLRQVCAQNGGGKRGSSTSRRGSF